MKFYKLASQFSPILCDRGTWNFFCILTHMDTLCKPNFMFLGHTVFEKNAMIILQISIRTFLALINATLISWQVSIAFFSDTVRPRNLKFFLYINPYGYSMQTKFHVPRSHSFREKCDDILKLASHFSPFFSDTVRPRNLKFFLYINPYGYSMQTKFHVPRSHSFREKCDDNLQKFKVAHSP